MTKATQFRIGADARCTDGDCGAVIRVVVNPVAQAVTHLVVEPKHREGLGRLVPLDLVDASDDGATVDLRCTLAEFEQLDRAEETHFLPNDSAYAGYAASQVFALPYYGLGMGYVSPPVVTDSLPLGEVGIRRGEHVHATDGELGKVHGLVIDPANHHVTHVLLQEGHIWGRKEVAIPIAAVASTTDGIRLTISKQEVEDLPPVDVDDLSGLV
jgi:sporulation protein YlmC with PRC-barrel domain